ncbi:MAG: hypothetical protein ACC700_18870 [Anaerolineales bacterium]
MKYRQLFEHMALSRFSRVASQQTPIHPYMPEDDGYLVLMERGDVDRVLDDLDMPWKLSEVPFNC